MIDDDEAGVDMVAPVECFVSSYKVDRMNILVLVVCILCLYSGQNFYCGLLKKERVELK